MTKKLIARVSGLALIAVAGGMLVTAAQASPPVCPKIYAPVICSNGKIYPNQCWADRHHAQDCVPYGEL